MTDRSVTHATFTLERTYPAETAAVFAAWAEPERKRSWFAGPGTEHVLDFRVGGQEVAHGVHGGMEVRFTTTYLDIVAGERIAYTSTMQMDGALTTASLTTVEFASTGDGTVLTLTEHGAYLDGHEKPEWRETGTGDQLDALGKSLAGGLS